MSIILDNKSAHDIYIESVSKLIIKNIDFEYINLDIKYSSNQKEVLPNGELVVFITSGTNEGYFVNVAILDYENTIHLFYKIKTYSNEEALAINKIVNNLYRQ